MKQLKKLKDNLARLKYLTNKETVKLDSSSVIFLIKDSLNGRDIDGKYIYNGKSLSGGGCIFETEDFRFQPWPKKLLVIFQESKYADAKLGPKLIEKTAEKMYQQDFCSEYDGIIELLEIGYNDEKIYWQFTLNYGEEVSV